MTPWLGFLKKEWTESVRSYKLLLVTVIFAILGVLNPFTAKIMPAVMANLLPEGAAIDLPDPTALDSWMQFYKNVPQMGLILFILLFSGVMSKELERGTLTILLTKGLRRSTVVTAKWVTGAAYWTYGLLLTAAITWAYTAYYWDPYIIQHLGTAVLCIWLFGLLLFTITLWGSTLFATGYGGLLAAVIAVIGLFLTKLIPDSADWSPLALLGDSASLLTGEAAPGDFTGPLLVAAGISAVLLATAIVHFNKKIL